MVIEPQAWIRECCSSPACFRWCSDVMFRLFGILPERLGTHTSNCYSNFSRTWIVKGNGELFFFLFLFFFNAQLGLLFTCGVLCVEIYWEERVDCLSVELWTTYCCKCVNSKRKINMHWMIHVLLWMKMPLDELQFPPDSTKVKSTFEILFITGNLSGIQQNNQ